MTLYQTIESVINELLGEVTECMCLFENLDNDRGRVCLAHQTRSDISFAACNYYSGRVTLDQLVKFLIYVGRLSPLQIGHVVDTLDALRQDDGTLVDQVSEGWMLKFGPIIRALNGEGDEDKNQ